MTQLLANRCVLITGGSKGLGRAMCDVMAREGADVVFNYSRSDDDADKTLKMIESHGRRGWKFKVSVTDRLGLKGMVKAIEATTDGIDTLVNNAGIGQVLPLALMEEEDWDQMLDTHVKGAFLATQAVLRGMIRRRKGTILNVSSLAGVRMIKAPVHYCTAKAAIKGFTESLAKEIAHYGITVNAIAPGLLETGVANNIPDDKLEEYLSFCALGRVGTTHEIAEFAAMMVSSRNSYMTGATIVLDGGV